MASSRVEFTISPLGFEHSLECEKIESENVKKVKFLRSCYLLLTCQQKLMEEISDIYF